MKKYLSLLVVTFLMLSLVSCSGDISPEVSDDTIAADTEERTLTGGTVTPTQIVVHEESDGYVYFDVFVRNDTESEIHTITLEISCLDKDGNIVDSTYPQIPVRVLAGQSEMIDGIVEVGDIQSVKLDGYSFYDKNDNYIDGRFDSSIEPVSVTEQSTIELAKPDACKAEIDADVSLGGESVLSIEGLSYDGQESGFKDFSAIIKNNGNETINTLTVNFIVLDSEGNICETTYPQIPNRIDPGQTVKMEALTDNENAVYFSVDGFSYYVGDDTDGEFVDGFFPTIPKAVPLN